MNRTNSGNAKALGRTGRMAVGAALLLFLGSFFVMPLYAALTLCTMPCCHHHGGPVPSVTADATPCGPNTCSIGAVRVATTVAPAAVQPDAGHRAAPVTCTIASAPQTAAIAPGELPPDDGSGRTAGAPLHILNSTLRI